jgi:hypothetical protein
MYAELRNRPMFGFIDYYLRARDAVALSNLNLAVGDLSAWSREKQTVPSPDSDARLFWLIVGLIESGEMSEARHLVEDFRPKDRLLMLAIHMGAMLVSRIKPVPASDRRVAEDIVESLNDIVSGMRNQLIEEFDSILLEMREGKAIAVDAEAETEDTPIEDKPRLPAPHRKRN